MNQEQRLVFAVAFFGALAFYAIAWALTTDQILQNVFDSATSSLKVVVTS